MNWIIAFVVAIVCFVIVEAGLMSKDIDIKDWQFWAIGLGETVGVLCIVYIVTRLWS